MGRLNVDLPVLSGFGVGRVVEVRVGQEGHGLYEDGSKLQDGRPSILKYTHLEVAH